MKRISMDTTEQGRLQKASLITAAYEIIAEKGLEGLRTRAVAERAGVNIATLHYYFPTKEDLIHGVTERLLQEFNTIVDPNIGARDANSKQRFKKEFADHVYVARNHPQTYVVLMELYARALRDAQLRVIFQRMVAQWEQKLRLNIAADAADGENKAAELPSAATHALQCMLMGIVTNLLLFGDEYPVPDIQQTVSGWLSAVKTN